MKLEHRFRDVVTRVSNLQRHLADARRNVKRRFAEFVRGYFDKDVVEADADGGVGDGLVVVVSVDEFQRDGDLKLRKFSSF